jgi:Zn-dependent peptidase ImmA (M78 family)
VTWPELVDLAEAVGAPWVDVRPLDDGVSALCTDGGIILVSANAPDPLFSLAHEIGHLVLRWQTHATRDYAEREAWCDAFARDLLKEKEAAA